MKSFAFNWIAFVVGLIIGGVYIYFKQPDMKTVVTYPTPYNAGKITYTDSADNCFVYVATKVDCPKDKSKVKPQPISEEIKT